MVWHNTFIGGGVLLSDASYHRLTVMLHMFPGGKLSTCYYAGPHIHNLRHTVTVNVKGSVLYTVVKPEEFRRGGCNPLTL